jgi:hypothetical protein
VTLTFNANQLLKTLNPMVMAGPKIVCRNSTATFSAVGKIPCTDGRLYRWSIAQGTGFIGDNQNGTADIQLTKKGISKVCFEPNFALCSPTITKTCMDVEVIDLTDPSASLKICPEEMPYVLDLKALVQKFNPTFDKEINPSTYYIKDSPGAKKSVSIDYDVTGANCTEKVNLNYEILATKRITLPSLLLCDGEKVNVRGKQFSCTDSKIVPQQFTVDYAGDGKQCDSSFTISVQCVKVTPIVSPQISILDCMNTSVVLDASKSTTLPAALPSGSGTTGVRSYKWSNGSTTSRITVSSPGTYTVTITYSYRWRSPTGFVSRTCSKSATMLVIGSVKNAPVTPLPKASKSVVCNGDVVQYYQPKLKNGIYNWTVTNGTIQGKSTGDSVKVLWSTDPNRVICCRLTAACGIGNDTCIQILSSSIVPKTPKLILGEWVATNRMRFVVERQSKVEHNWISTGVLNNPIGDTVIVNWPEAGSRTLCVRGVGECFNSADTCIAFTSYSRQQLPLSFNSASSDDQFLLKVIPNPVSEYFEVFSNRKIGYYAIFDLNGKLVVESSEALINGDGLAKGIYFLKVIDINKEVNTIKFLKL